MRPSNGANGFYLRGTGRPRRPAGPSALELVGLNFWLRHHFRSTVASFAKRSLWAKDYHDEPSDGSWNRAMPDLTAS